MIKLNDEGQKLLDSLVEELKKTMRLEITSNDGTAAAKTGASKLLAELLGKFYEEVEEDTTIETENVTPDAKVDDKWDEGLFLQTG